METTYFLIGGAVIVLLLDLWIINSVFRSDSPMLSKIWWSALVLLLPIVGALIWGITGPRGVTKGPSSPEHSKG
ncbi:PLD nuclease N-terminal domain-containing protein [Pseudomonas sp. B2M1-30]|uniref:PLDc N-terminal domain-containing protein n=1 Tax=Pseudomonas TaxID=286 RepID=UPI001C3E1CC5|nr:MULTISPECIES: PLDc N-terminal domain-containing protein [Pseudomonas]MBV4474745.1 PLD nuclease N-terminal domain-containing protein [Pseudomonas botevensis]MCU0117767.1 PLD nuclease N-terminal domain-containing protein [Pseudomonas sp. B2M1-30]MCU7259303.1 PLD nuclease N-terminal domain-containing protein [Pseudomonas koreensis]